MYMTRKEWPLGSSRVSGYKISETERFDAHLPRKYADGGQLTPDLDMGLLPSPIMQGSLDHPMA
jgi:hypothetical protein